MILDWRSVLRAASNHIKPGGRLHVVDFGRQEGLPASARASLRRWLRLFDVAPRDDLEDELSALAARASAVSTFQRPFRGYAQYGVVAFPPEPRSP
jgi:S-adenosylmethionine-diacylgycerolhomoserine-N-methlytransferase